MFTAPRAGLAPQELRGVATAERMPSELVVDALQMAIWTRQSAPDAIVHADRGGQYTSWFFRRGLRSVGLLGTAERLASSVDSTMMESSWPTMHHDLPDRRTWTLREELAPAILKWIEGSYNPYRRHSALGYRSPNDHKDLHTAATAAT